MDSQDELISFVTPAVSPVTGFYSANTLQYSETRRKICRLLYYLGKKVKQPSLSCLMTDPFHLFHKKKRLSHILQCSNHSFSFFHPQLFQLTSGNSKIKLASVYCPRTDGERAQCCSLHCSKPYICNRLALRLVHFAFACPQLHPFHHSDGEVKTISPKCFLSPAFTFLNLSSPLHPSPVLPLGNLVLSVTVESLPD